MWRVDGTEGEQGALDFMNEITHTTAHTHSHGTGYFHMHRRPRERHCSSGHKALLGRIGLRFVASQEPKRVETRVATR